MLLGDLQTGRGDTPHAGGGLLSPYAGLGVEGGKHVLDRGMRKTAANRIGVVSKWCRPGIAGKSRKQGLDRRIANRRDEFGQLIVADIVRRGAGIETVGGFGPPPGQR